MPTGNATAPWTLTQPHSTPSTAIGTATAEVRPTLRATAAMTPGLSLMSSMRAGRRVSNTCTMVLGPSSGQRELRGISWIASPQNSRTVNVASAS